MKLILLALVAFGTTHAFASQDKTQRKPNQFISGSKCGLGDSWGSDSMQNVSTTFDLSNSVRRVSELPKIVQAQLVATARLAETSITDPRAAAKSIRDGSEGQELYVLKLEMKDQKYSVISYYGGGNHTGAIFKWGQSKVHAQINDGDISCEK